jgi:hypothetical protein
VSFPNNFVGCALKTLFGSVVAVYVIVNLLPLLLPFVGGMHGEPFHPVAVLWAATALSPLFVGVVWYMRSRRRQARLQAEDDIGQNLRQGHTAFYLADDGEIVFVEEHENTPLSEEVADFVRHANNSE